VKLDSKEIQGIMNVFAIIKDDLDRMKGEKELEKIAPGEPKQRKPRHDRSPSQQDIIQRKKTS